MDVAIIGSNFALKGYLPALVKIKQYKLKIICSRNIKKIYQSNFYFKNIILENNWKKVFKKNIKIKIDNYLIRGSEALLSHENEKLQIYGNPATISSSAIDGQAEVFEIFPNKSMNLIGNARLSSEGNIIKSNLITYQISSNE